MILEKIKVNEMDVTWFSLLRKGGAHHVLDSAHPQFAESIIFGKMLGQVERDTILRQFKGI